MQSLSATGVANCHDRMYIEDTVAEYTNTTTLLPIWLGLNKYGQISALSLRLT